MLLENNRVNKITSYNMKFSLLFSLLPACREITHKLFGRPASDGSSDYTEYTFLNSRGGELSSEEREGGLDGSSSQSPNEEYTAAVSHRDIIRFPGEFI